MRFTPLGSPYVPFLEYFLSAPLRPYVHVLGGLCQIKAHSLEGVLAYTVCAWPDVHKHR